jgi:hypothetical protein
MHSLWLLEQFEHGLNLSHLTLRCAQVTHEYLFWIEVEGGGGVMAVEGEWNGVGDVFSVQDDEIGISDPS